MSEIIRFDNFAIWDDDSVRKDGPIIVAVRKRIDTSGWDESWDVASLTKEQAIKVRDYLNRYLEKAEEEA